MTLPEHSSFSYLGSKHKQSQSKIQAMIIKHLMDRGQVDIILPDGIILEIGITQLNKRGDLVKSDNYCFVSAKRDNRSTLLDSFNIGLSFSDEEDKIVLEDHCLDENGRPICRVDVI